MAIKEKLQSILGVDIFSKEEFEADFAETDEYEDEMEASSGYEEVDYNERSRGFFNFGARNRDRVRSREAAMDVEEPMMEEAPRERETAYRTRYNRTSGYSYEPAAEERRPAAVQMVLVRAKRFSEVERIAENLRQRRSVIINFDEMDKKDAQRMIDFLSGTTFAMKGSIQMVSKCTFVFAVGQVDLVGRIEEMSRDQEGVFGLF